MSSRAILGLPLANVDATLLDNLPTQIGGYQVHGVKGELGLRQALDTGFDNPTLLILQGKIHPTHLQKYGKILKHRPGVKVVGMWMGRRSPSGKSVFRLKDLHRNKSTLGINPVDQEQLNTAVRNNEKLGETLIRQLHQRWKTAEVLDHLHDSTIPIRVVVHTPLIGSDPVPEYEFQHGGGSGDQHLIRHDIPAMLMRVVQGGQTIPEGEIRLPDPTTSDQPYQKPITLLGGKRSKKQSKKQSKKKSKKQKRSKSKKTSKRKSGSKGRTELGAKLLMGELANSLKTETSKTQKKSKSSGEEMHQGLKKIRDSEKGSKKLDEVFVSEADFQRLLGQSPEGLGPEDLQKINGNEKLRRIYMSIYEMYFTQLDRTDPLGQMPAMTSQPGYRGM